MWSGMWALFMHVGLASLSPSGMVGRRGSPKADLWLNCVFYHISCAIGFFNQIQACESKAVIGKTHGNAS